MFLIAFWACFPDCGHKLNTFQKLSDKNKTWQPLQVLAALKGLLNSFTWLLLKDRLVLGCAQAALHRADPRAGVGLSCWFPWKSHSWSLDTATGTRWGFVTHVWCSSSTLRHWAKPGWRGCARHRPNTGRGGRKSSMGSSRAHIFQILSCTLLQGCPWAPSHCWQTPPCFNLDLAFHLDADEKMYLKNHAQFFSFCWLFSPFSLFFPPSFY